MLIVPAETTKLGRLFHIGMTRLVNAAYCYRPCSVVRRSVSRSVSLSHIVSPAKTAEAIELPFFGFYKTRHILLSNDANCTVLRAVVLTQYRRVTDRQTDGIAVANTALAMRALRAL